MKPRAVQGKTYRLRADKTITRAKIDVYSAAGQSMTLRQLRAVHSWIGRYIQWLERTR